LTADAGITLSVVVPATNAPDDLERCVSAVRAAHDGPDEIVVVEGPPQLGAAGARNAGAARAGGDVIVFVDADVVVHADAFTRIRKVFANAPELAAVFGAYDDTPAAPGRVSAFRNLLHHHVHHGGAGPAETFWTGLGAVRRDAFLAVGGFDEARFPHPSVEDVDLGDRLTRRGCRILLEPAIQGTHLKRWTLRSMVWTDFARRGVPWVAMQVSNRRVSSALNLGWRHRMSALAWVAAAAAATARRPTVAAGALGTVVVFNRGFYALLARRRGPLDAVLGVALHGLHHLVGVLAVPVGIVAGLTSWRSPATPHAACAAAGRSLAGARSLASSVDRDH
jgi:GT2 family glycosyltransferase